MSFVCTVSNNLVRHLILLNFIFDTKLQMGTPDVAGSSDKLGFLGQISSQGKSMREEEAGRAKNEQVRSDFYL